MKRIIPLGFVMSVTFFAVIAISTGATTAGLVPDDAVTLWAGAIAASDGQMPLGRIIAAYPTIPFLATTLFEFVTPTGASAPVLVTAAVLASLCGLWLIAFRRIGLAPTVAAAAAFLLVLHPALLRAAIAGPAEIFFAAFLFLLGGALYDLRSRSDAPEVIAVALALLGLTFSHPMGAAVACALVPLLVFSIRPAMSANWAVNLVIALVFPTVFCVGSFAYLSWVFPGSGWSFLVAPQEGLATWAVGFSKLFGRGLTGSLALDAGIAVAVALVLAAPVVPVATMWVWRRRPLVIPAIVVATMTAAAAFIAVNSRLFGDPAVVSVMPPILAAIVVIHVPSVRERMAVVLPLLVVGWFGGIAGLTILDPRGAVNVRVALEGRSVDQERMAAMSLGRATAGRDGILADTFNAPGIVLGRGRARGLLSPANDAFALGVMFSHIDAPFIAVPDPQIGTGANDRLNKAFPSLYRRGVPGYSLVYDNANWRLFARN